MKKCCQMLAKYFGVMAVVFLVLGLVTPTSWLWILGKVQGVSVLSVLLGVIMFGMGTTLDLKDFLVIFRRPRDIFLGALAQYTIMPFLAFALGTLFALEPGLTAGVVGTSHKAIMDNLGVILAVVVLFNTLGYVLGLAVAKLCGLSWKKAVTLSVEVGMQNSGLAAGLAKVHFASMPAAVVSGAIFSAWFTISGAVLAWACVNYLNPRFSEEEETEAVNVRELATD